MPDPPPRPARPGGRGPASGSPEEEAVRGGVHYLDVLAAIHRGLAPRRYLEIGVRNGKSLALAGCPAVGVDPAPEIQVALPPTTALFTLTSDDFFRLQGAAVRAAPPDLVFIDGMHLFEYALRDLINVEAVAPPGCLVVLDDVFPSHAAQAERQRRTRVWTGDVWKLHRTLQLWRPDLFLLALDTAPTGLLLVAGLDPANTSLRDRYAALAAGAGDPSDLPPAGVLLREGALPGTAPAVALVLATLAGLRDVSAAPAETAARLRAVLASGDG
jgi:hypothetical protein